MATQHRQIIDSSKGTSREPYQAKIDISEAIKNQTKDPPENQNAKKSTSEKSDPIQPVRIRRTRKYRRDQKN
jgi:hypothetical protein